MKTWRMWVVIICVGVCVAASVGPAVAQDVPQEREPDWNLEIFPFPDHNENGVWDIDSGEDDLIPASGTITYVASGTSRTWESDELPAQIRIPYGVQFRVEGEAEAFNVYDCGSEATYQMVDKGKAYVMFPCDPKNWFEYVNQLWISFLTN